MSELWHPGVNRAADAVVFNPNDELLLIERSDTDTWALPGGFVDETDATSEASARREVQEETGLTIKLSGVLVYSGMVTDPRNTLERWIETEAYVYNYADNTQPQGLDDAKDASWVPLEKLPILYGSHLEILRHALRIRRKSSAPC